MILEQDCRFQTTTTYWCECMEQIQLSVPSENSPRRTLLRIELKKYINKSLTESSELATMTSVSVRFEEMTASHRFELQSETKDNHQQSRKLRKCLSRSHCRKPKRVLF